MSSGRNGGAPTLGLEKFMRNNKEGEYTMWKDKFFTYIKEQDQIYERGLLEKDESPASVLMFFWLCEKNSRMLFLMAEKWKTYYLVDGEPTWEQTNNLSRNVVAALKKEHYRLVENTFIDVEAVEDSTFDKTEGQAQAEFISKNARAAAWTPDRSAASSSKRLDVSTTSLKKQEDLHTVTQRRQRLGGLKLQRNEPAAALMYSYRVGWGPTAAACNSGGCYDLVNPVCSRRSERPRTTSPVSYSGMVSPPTKRARRTPPQYEVDMLMDHRTEEGTEQLLVAWRHYAETTWEPASMLKDDSIPDWYFQILLTWKSDTTNVPSMRWAKTHVEFARFMQSRPNNKNDCMHHEVGMALWLLGHGGAVTQVLKDADMAAARRKALIFLRE
ncbi:hypothetical protein ON010_g9737 [Phytophthora cinnamomi]|nr:hypothetical protein ON010_g9737 [Phytophthora cinnamomi]